MAGSIDLSSHRYGARTEKVLPRTSSATREEKWRFFGGPFITVYQAEVYESFITSMPPIPGAIPAKTDIDNMVQFVDNNGSRVYSNQQLLLIDNRYL